VTEPENPLDDEIERGNFAVAFATYTSVLLFLAAVGKTWSFLMPLPGLFLLVAFALVHQGNRAARAVLVLGFACGAISSAFFGYGGYVLHHSTGLFLPAFGLGNALCTLLLTRPSVGAFMRHQRLVLLLPPSVGEETDDEDEGDG